MSITLARVSGTELSDDNLYLAYVAQSDSVEAEALEQEVTYRLENTPNCELPAFRFGFRNRYSENYAGYAGVQNVLQSILLASGMRGEPLIIGALLVSKALFLIGCAGLLLWISAGERKLGSAVAITFVAFAAAEILAQWLPTYWIVRVDQPITAIAQVFYSFFLPHESHSYFGLTPRNAASLLFVTAMVLKWRGYWIWASLLILSMSAIHQTYAAMALFFFTVSACVSQPKLLAGVPVRLILSATALVYLAREQFFNELGPLMRVGLAIGFLTIAYAAFQFISSKPYLRLRQTVLRKLSEREIILDVISLLSLGALITMVCLISVHFTDDPISRQYFWADLATRVWSFVRFPAVVGAVLILVDQLSLSEGQLTLAIVVTCTVASAVAFSRIDVTAWQRLSNEMQEQLDPVPTASILYPDREEARIYAHLTMLAAEQLDAKSAEANIIKNRVVKCEN